MSTQPPRANAWSIAAAKRCSSVSRAKPFRQRRIAARRLDDQHIDVRLRKGRALQKRLAIEIDVAGVKESASFGADQDSGGSQHMTGVAILESQFIVRPGRTALAIDRERLAERTMLPAIGRSIRLAMSEERINHTHLFALPRHHVDRIVQKRIANRGGRLGHENARLRLLPHQHRKRPDMIEMRVRKQKSVDRLARQRCRAEATPFRLPPSDASRNRARPPARPNPDSNSWRRSRSDASD